jgi:hypothetical protein
MDNKKEQSKNERLMVWLGTTFVYLLLIGVFQSMNIN